MIYLIICLERISLTAISVRLLSIKKTRLLLSTAFIMLISYRDYGEAACDKLIC